MLPRNEEELDSSDDMSVGESPESAPVIFDGGFNFGDLDFSGLSDAFDIGASGELIQKQVYPQEAVESGAEVSMFGRCNEMAGASHSGCTHSPKGDEVQKDCGLSEERRLYLAVCEKWEKERIEFFRSEAGKGFSLK
jgi:hypothetical protein